MLLLLAVGCHGFHLFGQSSFYRMLAPGAGVLMRQESGRQTYVPSWAQRDAAAQNIYAEARSEYEEYERRLRACEEKDLKTRDCAAPSSMPRYCAVGDGALPFTLQSKVPRSPDSWLLTFALPPARSYLAENPSLPTCLTVAFPGGTNDVGEPKILQKSYSPVSHPANEGTVDLLVKRYAPRPGGGVGDYLCGLSVGDVVDATLKSERVMHGSPAVLGRWREIGLVGAGTGIAPLVQIARIVLADTSSPTRVSLLSVNRFEQDILMREELDELASAHPERLRVTYSLTQPPTDGSWRGYTGRGSAEMVAAALPPPADEDGSTMVLVCATDGFVSMWAGPIGRAPPGPDGKKGPKVQGELTGLLAEAGFGASEVFKY